MSVDSARDPRGSVDELSRFSSSAFLPPLLSPPPRQLALRSNEGGSAGVQLSRHTEILLFTEAWVQEASLCVRVRVPASMRLCVRVRVPVCVCTRVCSFACV